MAGKTHDPNELLRGHRERIRAQVKEICGQVADLSYLERESKTGGLTKDQNAGKRTLRTLGNLLQGVENSTARDVATNAERSVDRERE